MPPEHMLNRHLLFFGCNALALLLCFCMWLWNSHVGVVIASGIVIATAAITTAAYQKFLENTAKTRVMS